MIKRSSTGPVRRTSARNPKTPSTMERTGGLKSSLCDEDNDGGDDAYTPQCFKATSGSALGQQTTDEQGNRCSILPGSSRPSKTRPASTDKSKTTIASFDETKKEPKVKKNTLEILNQQNASIKPLKEGEKL